jgi:hypothetical protein
MTQCRHRWWRWCGLFMVLLGCHVSAAESITPDQVVQRGMTALLKMQEPNGSFANHSGITSLAGMALLAGGSTATRGEFHKQSDLALHYVLNNQDKNSGYLCNDGGNMYSHGFATLYLAESYGMAPEAGLRRALEAAIDLIYRAQNSEGGWRYSPSPVDADLSVTICQIMALRAANNVGIGGQQTQDTIGRAIGYVKGCANGDGTFAYQIGRNYPSAQIDEVPRCAAGCMSLIGAGITDADDLVLGPGLRFLRAHVLEHLTGHPQHYWYGEYYAAQAMFHSPEPADWDMYWGKVVPVFTSAQNADGLWPTVDNVGIGGSNDNVIYSSVMALIILQIPNNYLPIFQR